MAVPFLGTICAVVDSNGEPLPERAIGEIFIDGPSVCDGYHDDVEATASTFTHKGLRTGDLGYLSDGDLFVTGRIKDVIILYGKNYDPWELERCVATVPGVRAEGRVVAVSRPGRDTEELVIVCEAGALGRESLTAEINHRLIEAFGVRAAEVVFVSPGALPRTTSGKLRRARVREEYTVGATAPEHESE